MTMSPLEGTRENDLLLAPSSTDNLGGERDEWEIPVGTGDGFETRKDVLCLYSLGSGTLDQQRPCTSFPSWRSPLSRYLAIPSRFYFLFMYTSSINQWIYSQDANTHVKEFEIIPRDRLCKSCMKAPHTSGRQNPPSPHPHHPLVSAPIK